MAHTKNFWIRRITSGWSRNGGHEILFAARNANPCRAANTADNGIHFINFFSEKPEGRNFPDDVRVIYNVPEEEFSNLNNEVAGGKYLCLDFDRKTLTKVFAYCKDTGE